MDISKLFLAVLFAIMAGCAGTSFSWDQARKILEEMRWAVMEHNADLEAPSAPKLLTSAEDIDDFFAKL